MNNSPWKREPLPRPAMPELTHWLAELQELDLRRIALLRKIELAMVRAAEAPKLVVVSSHAKREARNLITSWKD